MENDQKLANTSFDIVFDEKRVTQCPKKGMISKRPLTLDEIERKQQLAEKRRQARLAARIQRIKERDEATKKLVESVEVLLQQQALRNGQCNTPNVSRISQQELMKTANEVAVRFKVMQKQLLGMDLNIDEGQYKTRDKMFDGQVSTESDRSSGKGLKKSAVSFEIPVENDRKGKLRCKQPKLTRKEMERASKDLLANELIEKQERAAQRRQKLVEQKVRKTREGREALMNLQVKIDIYTQHQEAMRDANKDRMLSESEATCLAQEIADGFSNITSRYTSTLERAEHFQGVMGHIYSNK